MHRLRHAVRQLPLARSRRSVPVRFTALVVLTLSAVLIGVLAVPALSRPGVAPSEPSAQGVGAIGGPGPSGSPVPAEVAEDPSGVGTTGWLTLAALDPGAGIPSGDLTRALGAMRAQYGIPGISATIIWPDGRSWTATSGFADYDARIRLTRSSTFPIASVSKTFIAALVIQLADEGRFTLDDAVATYLPLANIDPRVTIRQLLEHTSGVYDFFSNSKIDAALLKSRSAAWTPSRALSYVKAPYFEPGTNWHYSNSNYVLLGQLVEGVTGTSYATLLRERFFEPLRLTSAYVQGLEASRPTLVHGYRFTSSSRTAKPSDLWDRTGVGPFRSVVTAAGAAGNVAASSWDLARWTRALYGGQLLTAPALSQMLDFSGTRSYRGAAPYGMGVQQYVMGGRIAYGHGGRLMGARSAVRYVVSEGISIAVVMNTDRGDPAIIANDLLAIIVPPLPPPTPTPLPTPGTSGGPIATPDGNTQPSVSPSPAPTPGPSATPTPIPSATV